VDFEVAGILAEHISEILKGLIEKQWIKTTKISKVTYYSIPKSRLIKDQIINDPKLSKLIHEKLLKYGLI
jgi:hypothetical protein